MPEKAVSGTDSIGLIAGVDWVDDDTRRFLYPQRPYCPCHIVLPHAVEDYAYRVVGCGERDTVEFPAHAEAVIVKTDSDADCVARTNGITVGLQEIIDFSQCRTGDVSV